ncbi:MAG: heavy-metal-associated domain-containing protein [Acidobacteria bacterium]|nr:heavy-metal-associated domain-containing protein [Acidobacteriota bacterium]
MPPRLVSWGGTVVQEIHHLETDLLAAAGKPGGGTEGDTGSPSGTGSRPRAGESTVTLKVSGMTCGGCEAAIRMALKKLDGVVSVHVDSTRGTATVAFLEATVTIEKIVEAIDQTGFKASLAQAPAGS